MASILNADTSNGLKLTSDTSGEIELQANGVTKAKVTANGLQDANNNVLATQNALGVRNLIINGDMRIDQRNAGASVTPVNGTYGIDRWQFAVTLALVTPLACSSISPLVSEVSFKPLLVSAFNILAIL